VTPFWVIAASRCVDTYQKQPNASVSRWAFSLAPESHTETLSGIRGPIQSVVHTDPPWCRV